MKLNNEFGYFGQPPVPNDQVVRYYFDVTPLGGWPVVEVGVGHDQVQPTGIPFWNRSTGPKRAEFNRLCERGIGKLPDRTPSRAAVTPGQGPRLSGAARSAPTPPRARAPRARR